MAFPRHLRVAFALLAALGSSPTAWSQTTAPVTFLIGNYNGARYVFEATPDRLAGLPPWDQRASPEPPVSMKDARRLAANWLLMRNPGVGVLAFVTQGLARAPVSGTWYHRVTYQPVVNGRRLAGGLDYVVIVLLDGSIVEPRVEAGGQQAPGRGVPGTTVARGTAPSPVAAQPAPVTEPPSPSAAPTPLQTASAPASRPLEALALGDVIYRPGNGVTMPRVLQQVPPRYTEAATSAKTEGVVVLDAVVNTDGSVSDVKVVRSLDASHGLDQEAIKAITQWKFGPGTRAGIPVRVRVTVEMEFKLGASR